MNEIDVDWAGIPGSKWYCPDRVIPAFAALRHKSDESWNAILSTVANNHCGELYPAAFHAVPILLEIAMSDTDQRTRAKALATLDNMMFFSPGLAPFDTVEVDGVSTQIDVAIRKIVAAALPSLETTEAEHPVSALIRGLRESLTELESQRDA